MTKSNDEISGIINDLREDWDLVRYAGSDREGMAARDEVIARAIRQLPECVTLDRVSAKTAWRWTHRWKRHADREEVVKAILNDKPEAMELLKAAVERTRRGPQILISLRVQWNEVNQPVLRHQAASVLRRREKLIDDAVVLLPDVARDIAFFRSRDKQAPVCKWCQSADRENIAEAVLNHRPDSIDRLCEAMDPPVIRSPYDVISDMQSQWAAVKDSVRDVGILRYAEEYDLDTGEAENITLESVNAARRKARENVIRYAMARLPGVAAEIAPLRWRSGVNAEDIVAAVLNGEEDGIERLVAAVGTELDVGG